MKTAVRTVPVFCTAGDYVIGEVSGGGKALVLGETDKGMVVAYILGIVKPEHSHMLVEESKWSTTANEKPTI